MSFATNDSLSDAYDIITKVPLAGVEVLKHARTLPRDTRGAFLRQAAQHFIDLLVDMDNFTVLPVDVQTFIESEHFLNRRGVVYPAIMDELRELNSGRYVEAVLTGAIGTGKSTIALLTTAYQLYVLSCLKDPHRLFNLDPASEIVFAFQSLNMMLAKSIDYQRFRSMLETSPYFNRYFRFNKKITAEMVFPNHIVVRPLSGNVNAAIGSNIFGGILDEINFMARVEQSKNAVDGGEFDQGLEMYNSVSRRRKSRFMAGGRMPGMLCLVSSKRYPGEFTEQKQIEAREEIARTGKTGIFVYDRTLWQIKPQGTSGDKRFNLFLGDVTHKPCILEEGTEVAREDAHLVMEVPEEFRSEFTRDILSAIRDIAGSATFALHPFIVNTEAVSSAFGQRQSVLSVETTDFVASRPLIYPRRIIMPDEPRFAHVDLGLSGDSAGIAVGWVEGFKEVASSSDSAHELMPQINLDLILEVKPPRGGEIEFENIRKLFYRLRELGMNLKWISFDSYQSADSIQILRQKGFTTGLESMDKNSLPYDVTKTAFYDGRIAAPKHEKALSEIVRLERDPQSGRIDHPPNFSKDCADAVAGVVYGLTYRRASWVRYGVPINPRVQEIVSRIDRLDKKSEAARRERYA